MIQEKKIKGLVLEALTESQFIVDLWVDASNKIYVEVDDSNGSISINDCIKVSRQVEHNLDREAEDFALEVTSPGLDKPFKVREQYVKNIGREVKVRTTEEKTVKGKLTAVDDDSICLEYREKERIEGRKAKQWVDHKVTLTWDEVKDTFVELIFK